MAIVVARLKPGRGERSARRRGDAARAREFPRGSVSLVGAGPGDPDLLTLKGARRLRQADVVYYDALVDSELLGHCRPGAVRVPVGKRRGRLTLPQEGINGALVRDARAGRRVVRLKGGDPFVFGRGGEEALALLRAGVPFEVVPGVTSGVAVPALAGIPVTHRGLSTSAAFVTAHDLADGPEGEAARRRLGDLARGADTLVVFMAGAHLGRVERTLLEAGLPEETPAAVIESGSFKSQCVRRGTLRGLSSLGTATGEEAPGGAAKGQGPVLIVLGRTVALGALLAGGGCGATSAVDIDEALDALLSEARTAAASGLARRRR